MRVPEQVARREVIEETGCTLKALTHIGEFVVSRGCRWSVSIYTAGGSMPMRRTVFTASHMR